MIDECRHGFDPELCAICNPPKEPEKRSTARTSTSTRSNATTRAGRSGSVRSAGGPSAARSTTAKTGDKAKPVRIDRQRLFHVTHIDNLPSILSSGAIVCDDTLSDDGREESAAVRLSSDENSVARRRIQISGAALSAYVPFFLSPDAAVWASIRGRYPNVRLNPELLEAGSNDFVMLVTTVAQVRAIEAELVIADGDAAAGLTQFSVLRGDVDRALTRYAVDDTGRKALTAEALVRDSLPLSALQVIGVSSIKQRERVKRMLSETDVRAKVAAYQPWFAAD